MVRVEYDRLPPQDVREQVCGWLRHHCIDPREVAVPGWIELRPEARQIAYEAFLFDDDDELIVDDTGDDGVRETRVMQLEAKPSPFPPALEQFAASEA